MVALRGQTPLFAIILDRGLKLENITSRRLTKTQILNQFDDNLHSSGKKTRKDYLRMKTI